MKTVFKKYFLQCAPLLPIASFHGIFKWKLLSMTTLVEGRKQKWTIILTQIPLTFYCLVCIKIVSGQYLIEDILLKIPYQAYFINIIRKSEIEFLGIPLLLAILKEVMSVRWSVGRLVCLSRTRHTTQNRSFDFFSVNLRAFTLFFMQSFTKNVHFERSFIFNQQGAHIGQNFFFHF